VAESTEKRLQSGQFRNQPNNRNSSSDKDFRAEIMGLRHIRAWKRDSSVNE